MRVGELGWVPSKCVLVQQRSQRVARIPERRVKAGMW